MTKRFSMRACAAAVLLIGCLPQPALAGTVFCLANGTQINAERFETQDGNFLLYVEGNPTPISYRASEVKGVNVPCATVPPPVAPPAATIGIHGSNTIGERLMPMLIEAYGVKRHGAKPAVKLMAPEEQEITLRQRQGGTTVVDLKAHGSGTSARDLIDGKSAIGMSSRRANDAEAAEVQQRFGVDLRAPGNEHVLALDGLAVIVNPANPVKQLSLEQIGRIFAGQITRWSEVGGGDRPINVFRRDDKSGTTDTFKALVLGPGNLKFGPQAKAFESSETVSASVASDADAIGFIGLPYINKNQPLAISASCGIVSSPSHFTVKTEDYPLARRLYLYTIGRPTDAVARDLLQFSLSDEAQPTIQDAEFIDQGVVFQDELDQRRWGQSLLDDPRRGLLPGKDVPQNSVSGFTTLLRAYRRTSMVFRFESGKADLDTRALQDIDRLARHLSSGKGAGKRFVLIGFADSRGSWRDNLLLAGKRAAEVAVKLVNAGVQVTKEQVLSASYMAPVACSDGDLGLSKNRRVEVWIAR